MSHPPAPVARAEFVTYDTRAALVADVARREAKGETAFRFERLPLGWAACFIRETDA